MALRPIMLDTWSIPRFDPLVHRSRHTWLSGSPVAWAMVGNFRPIGTIMARINQSPSQSSNYGTIYSHAARVKSGHTNATKVQLANNCNCNADGIYQLSSQANLLESGKTDKTTPVSRMALG